MGARVKPVAGKRSTVPQYGRRARIARLEERLERAADPRERELILAQLAHFRRGRAA